MRRSVTGVHAWLVQRVSVVYLFFITFLLIHFLVVPPTSYLTLKGEAQEIEFMAEAVRDGRLVIPIGQKPPLGEAAKAQGAAEKGGSGRVLLVAQIR